MCWTQLRQEGQKRLSGDLGEGIGDYDYNNANDTANFCPGLQVRLLLLLSVVTKECSDTWSDSHREVIQTTC